MAYTIDCCEPDLGTDLVQLALVSENKRSKRYPAPTDSAKLCWRQGQLEWVVSPFHPRIGRCRFRSGQVSRGARGPMDARQMASRRGLAAHPGDVLVGECPPTSNWSMRAFGIASGPPGNLVARLVADRSRRPPLIQ
jgi:hypothetical protein